MTHPVAFVPDSNTTAACFSLSPQSLSLLSDLYRLCPAATAIGGAYLVSSASCQAPFGRVRTALMLCQDESLAFAAGR